MGDYANVQTGSPNKASQKMGEISLLRGFSSVFVTCVPRLNRRRTDVLHFLIIKLQKVSVFPQIASSPL